jgi:glycosyltransferase involved in cell wall biosynthesis
VNNPVYSVVIPTCNHPDLLQCCLSALEKLQSPEADWEVLIMDNSDEAIRVENARVANSFVNPRFRYVSMTLGGLMAARHQGVELARGSLISFIDDDTFVSENWLGGIELAFQDSSVGLVTGPIRPQFEGDSPPWLEYFWTNISYGHILGYLSLLDFGDENKIIPAQFVWGCNYSIRKEIFHQAKGSHPDYLPGQWQVYQGDGEVGLSVKVAALGYTALYSPQCAIWHWVPQARLTEDYLGKRAFFIGLHSSFTGYRREHRLGPVQGVLPLSRVHSSRFGRLRAEASRIKQWLWTSRWEARNEPGDVIQLKQFLRQRQQAGWDFHRRALRNDAGLQAYVLRPDFMGEHANLPHEQAVSLGHARK